MVLNKEITRFIYMVYCPTALSVLLSQIYLDVHDLLANLWTFQKIKKTITEKLIRKLFALQ